MKRTMAMVLVGVLAAAASIVAGTGVSSGDTTPVAFTCDIPAAQGGAAAGLIPDTVPLDNDITINDSPDPVAPGGTVSYDLDVPFPDLTGDLPDLGFALGYVYIRSIDITQPIPPGLDLNSVTATLNPDPSWASVSRQGSNLVIHVQSAYPTVNDTNGRIRVNPDVTPTTIEVQETNGTWVPIDFIPSVHIEATVNGAAGSTIDWKAPSILAKLFYKKFIIFLININWNDVNTPCTPDNPNQTVVSTLIGSPSLSVSTSATQSSVVAGQPINLSVTVTNTGNMALTGVTVTDPNAPGCAGSPGNLAVGAQVTLNCTVTTSAANIPTFSNSATADSNETAPVNSNTVNVGVVAPSPGTVSGTVTETGSGDPIPGAWVALLSSSNYAPVGGAVANGSGVFNATVNPGTYYAYAIDPSGEHTAGFFGPPTPVTVTNGGNAAANPTLAPTQGAIAGAITSDGGGPVAGAWAIVMSAAGAPEQAAIADGSGNYRVDGLSAGNHKVVYVDPTGAHRAEFFDNSATPNGSSNLAVTAGGTTTANAGLPTDTPNAGGSTISGTVTEAGTGQPLAGVYVATLRASDYKFAVSAVTNASGQYSINVAPGEYKMEFFDPTGAHAMEWHDNLPFTGIGSANSVTAPATINADLDPLEGNIGGTITDQTSGNPLAGAWVIAINGQGAIAGGAVTAANGTYTIAGLPAGVYRVTIADPAGGRTQEYFDNSPNYAGSTPVNVTAGQTSTASAALALP